MPRIILASGSAQRKKLLKQIGLTFTVEPSGADELTKVTTTPATLVKQNAIIKASDIAAKHKSGIIIGADTVVYIGNKEIIGKPKSLSDARRILRILFSKPQWIYTGVVIIDAATGKRVLDYEKTRVFMEHLTDKEIQNYHKKVNPFDKAGGFDIEGRGSIFIRRIEGCYTNVIGLPIAKVVKMLKQFGVEVL